MSRYLIRRSEEIATIVFRFNTDIWAITSNPFGAKQSKWDKMTSTRSVTCSSDRRRSEHPLTNGCIALDAEGFIKTGPDLSPEIECCTLVSLPICRNYSKQASLGVFVADDARGGSIKRAAYSVGGGSIAISFVHKCSRNRNRSNRPRFLLI
jgi:thioredoxin reductase (NADPH)